MEKIHRGVGAFITTPERDIFFLQQKDETYPIEKWRLSLSVWGGAMEADDISEEAALRRELIEELNWMNVENILKLGHFTVQSDRVFPITLFEIVLPKAELLAFAANAVSEEGYCKLVERSEIWNYSWVWDLDSILKNIIGA